MNIRNKLIIGLALAAIGTSGGALAHDQGGKPRLQRDEVRVVHDRHGHDHRDAAGHCFSCRVDARQDRQHRRIREGWKSGELTRHELRRLREQQERIARMERRFEADGHLSRNERRQLDNALDKASEQIARAKNNAADRAIAGHAHADRWAGNDQHWDYRHH